jgi:hypothetical protein
MLTAHKNFALTLLLALLYLPVQAQESVSEESSPAENRTPVVSAPFASKSLAFQPELERTNYLDAGLSVGSTFDSNALNSSADPRSDIGYSLLPHLGLKQSLGHLDWKLSYSGGFTVHQHFSAYNQGSHDFGFDSTYKLAEHIDLLVRDHFLMTSGFFDQVNQEPGTSSGSILQQPNQSVITPLANQVSNVATVAINDQFSASSAIGGGATGFRSYYKNAPAGTTLIDTNSQTAEAYYNRRVSARHSIGVTYRFQRFTFTPVANNTTANSILATYTLHFQANMTLSLFGGPQHVDTAVQSVTTSVALPQIELLAVPASRHFWTGTGGATYVWNGLHNGVTADVIRGVSDGGGLLGAVTLTSADVGFRRQLSRRLTSTFGFIYGQNDSVGLGTTAYSSLKSVSGGVSVTRQLRDNFGFTVGYRRDFQLQGNAGVSTPDANVNHNRVWVSISYQVTRPIGQ